MFGSIVGTAPGLGKGNIATIAPKPRQKYAQKAFLSAKKRFGCCYSAK
jgi:hypothetical protein